MMHKCVLILLCFVPLLSYAQADTEDLNLGNKYFEDLQYRQAIASYDRTYQKIASEAALCGLAKSHLELGLQYQFIGSNTERQTQFTKGLTDAEELYVINALNPAHRLVRGLLCVYNQLFEKARGDFEYVRKNFPDNGQVYHYLWILEPLQGQEKIDHPYVKNAFSLDSGFLEFLISPN